MPFYCQTQNGFENVGFSSRIGLGTWNELRELDSRHGLVTLDSYRLRDAIVVRAGDASESAIVAQLVPAAEIH